MASLVPGPPAAAHRLARNAPRPQTAPASHLRQPLNTEQVALPPQHGNYHLSSSHATSAGSPPSLSSQLHLHLPPKQVACHLSRQITSLSFDCSHVLAPQTLAKFFLRYMCKPNCNSVAFSRSISQTSHVAGLHRRSTHSCSGLIMLLSVQQCIPPMHADSFVSRQKQVGGSCVGFHAFPILQVCKVLERFNKHGLDQTIHTGISSQESYVVFNKEAELPGCWPVRSALSSRLHELKQPYAGLPGY